MSSFSTRLREKAAERGRLCVGIDPHEELLRDWGLDAGPDGLRRFCEICVAAFGEEVSLIKPQVAFFERYGSAGYAVLEDTISALRDAGALVLADAKRGDIGSTMRGYAQAWLAEDSPLSCDALTLSPYLGLGSLSPAIELAESLNKGLFILAATSNPEASTVQNARTESGPTLSQTLVDDIASINAKWGKSGGNLGVVVGATLDTPPQLGELNGPVLLPGVGAQGATAHDVARICEGVEALSFPNMSRGILKYGPSISALRDEVQRIKDLFPGV